MKIDNKIIISYYTSVKDGKGRWRDGRFQAVTKQISDKRVEILEAKLIDAPRGCTDEEYWERQEIGKRKNISQASEVTII